MSHKLCVWVKDMVGHSNVWTPIIYIKILILLSHKACQSLGKEFPESITEDDYKNAVIQVIDGPEKKSCDENSENDTLEQGSVGRDESGRLVLKILRTGRERLN